MSGKNVTGAVNLQPTVGGRVYDDVAMVLAAYADARDAWSIAARDLAAVAADMAALLDAAEIERTQV